MKISLEDLLLFVFMLNEAVAQNYCNSSLCPNGKKHIGCKNNGAFSSRCASSVRMVKISTDLRMSLLNQHNQFRNRIASGNLPGYDPAIRMATMQWDSELAYLAALNVKQCVMRHDGCRSTHNFPFAGQNLAVTSWFGKTMTVEEIALEHIRLWFEEYKDASMAYIDSYKNRASGIQIGHFTQLVQEKATNVGCAILKQEHGSTSDQFMACDYAFTNIYNRPVYRSGNSTSQCTTGVNSNFKSLCSIEESYDVKSTYY